MSSSPARDAKHDYIGIKNMQNIEYELDIDNITNRFKNWYLKWKKSFPTKHTLQVINAEYICYIQHYAKKFCNKYGLIYATQDQDGFDEFLKECPINY